jgi:hypothetical protein
MVLALMVISIAQLMLGLWFCGTIQSEISHTRNYASKARLVTVQLKDEKSSLDPIRELLSGRDATVEEWSTEEVLSKMEQEEPDLIQTVRSVGSEGLQLFPKLAVLQGVVPDEVLDQIKMMTEVARVDSSPVHHARLLGFYGHLETEIRIAVLLLIALLLVQLVVFQRIQARDTLEVMRNLVSWGVAPYTARLPALISMIFLSGSAALISVGEWICFRTWVWKYNAFLGELSLDHSLPFPWSLVALTLLALMGMATVLVYSGRIAEE